VRCVDVWTSLSAKVCVFQNVSPEFGKGRISRGKLLTRDFMYASIRKTMFRHFNCQPTILYFIPKIVLIIDIFVNN